MFRKRAAAQSVVSTRHYLRTIYLREWERRAGSVPTSPGYFDDVLKPKPNPMEYYPEAYVPPAAPEPLVFPSGMSFVSVPWTFQKAKEIKQRRFEIALGAFKMGYEVPYLTAYRDIHKIKADEQQKLDKKEAHEERKKERKLKQSMHGYEAAWHNLWSQEVTKSFVPYPDPLPTDDEWAAMGARLNSDEFYRPYRGLSTTSAVEKFIKEEWGRDRGPVAKRFMDKYKRPGVERKFHPYLDEVAWFKEFPDPWNMHNWEYDDLGFPYDADEKLEASEDFMGDESPDRDGDISDVDIDEDRVEAEGEDEEMVLPSLAKSREGGRLTQAGGDALSSLPEDAYNKLMGIDPEESVRAGNPEELVEDFRELVNIETDLTPERNPFEVPPGERTPAERQKVIEDRELFRSFYELRTWLYMQRKLAQHGLVPSKEPDLEFAGDDDDDDERKGKAGAGDEEDKKKKSWLLGDLAKAGVSEEEDAERKEAELLKAVDDNINLAIPRDFSDREILGKVAALKLEVQSSMREVVQSERKPPAARTHFHPIEFTTFTNMDPDYVMGPLARRKFAERKVVLRVWVPALGLPTPAVARLKQLTGSRFNEKTGMLKLVGDKHSNKWTNKQYVKELFRELVHNAMLADPNYVPISDLSADIRELIPRPELPENLQEDLAVLSAPPLVSADTTTAHDERRKKAQWNYRLFRFNFYKNKTLRTQEQAFHDLLSKA